jgi:outer membrane protein assembly factor BamD (BamD/ComL family)
MKRSLCVLALLCFFACGCAGLLTHGRDKSSAPAIKSAEAKKLLDEHRYPESVAAFQRIIKEYPNSDWSANAIYNIATAFVSVQNPRKDYTQALAHFEDFLYKYPQHERATDAKNWRQAIKVIIDAKKENERLLRNLEQLKQLDMRQEQKRQGK